MKKNMRFLVLISLLIPFIFYSCNKKEQKAKYIFLMIGDGMGLSQSLIAENYLDAMTQDTATVHIDFLRMPISGYASTHSANSLITCSSAAGTALSTGTKTNNGMLGVTPDTSNLTAFSKTLHNNGYLVGIITNVSLDHATPGAFYANSSARSNYDEIARQIPDSKFEYFGGGNLLGALYDSTLTDYIKSKNYILLNNDEQIKNHKLEDGKLVASSNIVGKSMDIPYVIDMPDHYMDLPYFVKKGIDLFEPSNKNFFMMIEGGKIDWACHSNDAATAIHEVISFNEAFKHVYDFYQKHPDETLIVMTADHETGGLALGRNETKYSLKPQLLQYQKISEWEFNFMADSLIKAKVDLNTLYKYIEDLFGFNNGVEELYLTKKDSIRINNLYNHKMKLELSDNINLKYDDENSNSIASLCTQILAEKAGIGWTTGSHTGIGVPVRAIGCGAEHFNGYIDNTDIPKLIMRIAK